MKYCQSVSICSVVLQLRSHRVIERDSRQQNASMTIIKFICAALISLPSSLLLEASAENWVWTVGRHLLGLFFLYYFWASPGLPLMARQWFIPQLLSVVAFCNDAWFLKISNKQQIKKHLSLTHSSSSWLPMLQRLVVMFFYWHLCKVHTPVFQTSFLHHRHHVALMAFTFGV